ncbi:MAG: gliding motility protein GldL, partial [Bacteroidales bacterium]
MKIREFVQQRWWRNYMGYLYSWGASIVMIGALMKLEHFPLSSYFLIGGLGTEAIIFFFAAFEPLPEAWEWDRVYPELADKPTKVEKKLVRTALSGTPTQRFDEMLAKAEISPELFTKLGNGMQKLAESSNKMSEISHAHIETQQYMHSIKKASDNLNSFGDAYKHSTEELNRSTSTLTQSYTKTAELISKLSTTSHGYTNQLEKMNKNLGALNSVYELQLRGEDAHLKTSKAVYKDLDAMIDNLQATVQNTKQYRDEVEKLGKKLSALNKVYGNMLTAMNVK